MQANLRRLRMGGKAAAIAGLGRLREALCRGSLDAVHVITDLLIPPM